MLCKDPVANPQEEIADSREPSVIAKQGDRLTIVGGGIRPAKPLRGSPFIAKNVAS